MYFACFLSPYGSFKTGVVGAHLSQTKWTYVMLSVGLPVAKRQKRVSLVSFTDEISR